MGITERKEKEREEMRAMILHAAQKIFLENGYEKTSIRNISDAIEYSPATIYLYYKDKNEILFAIHQHGFEKMISAFEVLLLVSDPMDRLKEMGNYFIAFALENPDLYNLMFVMDAPMETLDLKNQHWQEGADAFNAVKLCIQNCIEAGYLEVDTNVELVSLTVWSYLHGLLMLYLKDRLKMLEDDRNRGRIYESFALFLKMLKKPI
jgi:AcrR family transcriptional regulator